MVSDNGVSNSKDLKGVFTTITDSTSYPKTPYYMDKSTDRENSVTLENESYTSSSSSSSSSGSGSGLLLMTLRIQTNLNALFSYIVMYEFYVNS